MRVHACAKTDKRTDGQKDRMTDRQTDGRTDRRTKTHARTYICDCSLIVLNHVVITIMIAIIVVRVLPLVLDDSLILRDIKSLD